MTRIAIFVSAVCFALALCAGSAVMAYTPPSVPPPTKNVYETIAANKKLGKFTGMINEAGLKDMLTANTGEPVTVFAPSDEALSDIPSDVMKRVQASKTSLQSFVKYHIIAGSMVSSGAIKGRRASPASANGEALSFDGTDRAKPPKIGDGLLEQGDIAATNGIVHIVSSGLVPPSLQAPPAPPPAALAKPTVAATPAPAPVPTPTPTPAPAAAATTSAADAAPAAVTPPAPVHVTTSGVAKPPPAAAMTTSGGLPPPGTVVPLSQTGTGNSGFELFGHKFGW